mgnify:FL=1
MFMRLVTYINKGISVSNLTSWDCITYALGGLELQKGTAALTDRDGFKPYILGASLWRLGRGIKDGRIQGDANRVCYFWRFYPYIWGDCPWAIFMLPYIPATTKVRISV